MEAVIIFIIILGVLILVHELGHFVSAIKLGVDVEEFAIGFPPKIVSWVRKGVKYSINWIPMGGFVKITGEQGEGQDDPRSFVNQPAWKKLIIISAGVFMNFVLAFVLLSIVFMAGFPQELTEDTIGKEIKDKNVVILQIAKDSPADKAGLDVGDKILEVNGQAFDNYEDVYTQLEFLRGEDIALAVRKGDNQEETYNLKHEILEEGGELMIGVGITETGIIEYGFFGSIVQGFKVTIAMIVGIVAALYNLVKDLITEGNLASGFGGPVAVAVVTGQIVKLGFINIVYFAAILSINLGVINFFPFPALDGGRALFILLEAITRKKLNEKAEAWIHNSGFIILVAILVAVTLRDFKIYGAGIWNAVTSWFM
ncbi:MAG: PDZ domain-containing protein [Candidatus Komeilibacteria bacterium]|jgi:regulator of sigma E protease|nr:PDZ domain-containing protein [Candidatus Komeilibacteria bacterium]MBT4447724.1 PDZ domain-containing protein [Candidatus Komeilibacteria bacterium]